MNQSDPVTAVDNRTICAISPGQQVEVLQFTDLHLLPTPQATLWDINPYANFMRVLHEAIVLYPSADLLLFTGDLVDNPTAEAYELLRDCLINLDYPVFRLPGNHDDVHLLNCSLCDGNIHKEQAVELGEWQIILLDSNAPSDIGGRLDQMELQRLEKFLQACPEQYALVCLHHHPVPIDSPWMDAMALRNPQDLFEILDRYPQVRGVIWGHIHQEFEAERRAVRLLGAPATSIQFVPRSTQFQKHSLGPGFRWLGLAPDGVINTRVHYR